MIEQKDIKVGEVVFYKSYGCYPPQPIFYGKVLEAPPFGFKEGALVENPHYSQDPRRDSHELYSKIEECADVLIRELEYEIGNLEEELKEKRDEIEKIKLQVIEYQINNQTKLKVGDYFKYKELDKYTYAHLLDYDLDSNCFKVKTLDEVEGIKIVWWEGDEDSGLIRITEEEYNLQEEHLKKKLHEK
jgi:hypothetical protein